jgi:transcription antitermination factor NusG
MGRTASSNLKNQSFENFLPEIREFRRGSLTTVQLFPGYIFVRFDISDERVRWRSINGSRGVIKLLPTNLELPLPLPVGFVEDFRDRIMAGELDEKPLIEIVKRYSPEEIVPVLSGPFGGLQGKMLRYHKGCLVLLMHLLGGKVEVEVPNHQVRAPASLGDSRVMKMALCGSF